MAIKLASDVASKPQRTKRGYTSTTSGQLAQRAHVVISTPSARSSRIGFRRVVALRVYAGKEAVKTMVGAGSPREYLTGKQPLVRLIEEMSQKKDGRQISICKAGLSLTFEKSSACAQHAQTSSRAP